MWPGLILKFVLMISVKAVTHYGILQTLTKLEITHLKTTKHITKDLSYCVWFAVWNTPHANRFFSRISACAWCSKSCMVNATVRVVDE